jgi:hypothetical protein
VSTKRTDRRRRPGLSFDLPENAGHAVLTAVFGEKDGIFDVLVEIPDFLPTDFANPNRLVFERIEEALVDLGEAVPEDPLVGLVSGQR